MIAPIIKQGRGTSENKVKAIHESIKLVPKQHLSAKLSQIYFSKIQVPGKNIDYIYQLSKALSYGHQEAGLILVKLYQPRAIYCAGIQPDITRFWHYLLAVTLLENPIAKSQLLDFIEFCQSRELQQIYHMLQIYKNIGYDPTSLSPLLKQKLNN